MDVDQPGPGHQPGHSSMADVAASAEVSVSTVSRALRGSPLVSPATMRRVQDAARRLEFTVSRTASSLATGRTGRVAVLVGGRLGTWFNGTTLEALSHVLRSHGLDLLVFTIETAAERTRFFERLPAQGNADALVVVSFALSPGEHEALDRLGIPVVYLNQRVEGATSVAIDDRGSAAAGTHYLLNLGHRRLAFCGVLQTQDMAWSAVTRVDGYRDALAAVDLDTVDHPVLLEPYGHGAEDMIGRLLGRREPPTAIFAESDEIAFGLLAALGRAGVRVPDDMSVLGFDDHQLAAELGLTTMAQPVTAMARHAGELAVQLLLDEQSVPVAIPVETRLVVRRTTGPPRTRTAP